MCQNNVDLKNFLKTIDNNFYKEAILPRDALFGGRTENFCVSHTVTGSEKIYYVDVTSLYPSVLKKNIYPLGHPKVFVLDDIRELCPDNNISNVIGLIKCRVLPPPDLYIPVLPMRCHKKLFFPLCNACTLTLNQENCTHNESERALIGTWVSEELKVAVEKGTGGLFTGCINKFLKIKQEASGWPVECVDDASKQAYIDNYSKVEGIDLDPTKIEKNPGLRQVSKNNLNSLWGRLAMDNISDMYSIIQNIQDFNKIIEIANIKVSCITIIDDDTLFVNWKYFESCDRTDSSTNPVLGAFTTAHARLELYKYLDKVQSRVLYVDTDSIVFISENENDKLPLGNYLGDLTDELDGGYIKTFISGGPKFYSYIAEKPDVNYDSIKTLTDGENDKIIVTCDSIRRTKEHDVHTISESKTVRVTGPKRKFTANMNNTLPYGYNTMYNSGPSEAGKSVWTKRFLKELSGLCDTEFDRIILYYAEWQPVYTEDKNVEFQEGLPDMKDFNDIKKKN
ncbi:DNA polymerase-like [Aphidius gifuensis]|uniref:DNA polymerase-like n=1 Tax=Aphidius gifuensis TaxID=684658 RepID=UPI001CDBF498|nr:DNA polymerase-like [Aphidius gifuensis]